MEADRTRIALESLDPQDRALLELAGVRGLADHQIGGMLGLEVARVGELRREALGRLAVVLHCSQRQAQQALAELASDAPAAAPVQEKGSDRRGLAAGLGGLAIAAGVAVALALGGGDRSAPEGERPGGQARGAVPLRAVTSDAGRGSARIVESRSGEPRLRVSVSGLPAPGDDRYAVWLYDSVSNERRLGSFPDGAFTSELPLPEGYESFRFLDVSREPGDGNRAHSGESILRVPLRALPVP